jgi:hypothetical protein
MRDYTLTDEQAPVADQVADIMDAIATASEYAAMSDPVFAAWMLGCIHSALTTAHKARLPGEDWEKKIRDIRDDAMQLRFHPRPLRGRLR